MIFEAKILEKNVNQLIKEIEKINRRSKKLGINPLSYKISETPEVVTKTSIIKGGLEAKIVKVYVNAIIEGDMPKIDGWKLITVFERVGDFIMTRKVPGESLPDEYIPQTISCQHCNKTRHRNQSMLLHNEETGKYIEVGTSCVRDFIGYDPKAWLHVAGIEPTINNLCVELDECNYGGNDKPSYSLDFFLAITNAVINLKGWKSKAFAEKYEGVTPTICDVMNQFNVKAIREGIVIPVVIEKSDYEMVEKAKEYFMNQSTVGNDYVRNIQIIIQLGYVPSYKEGIAASIMGSFRNHLKKQLETEDKTEKEAKRGKVMEWIGEKGKRQNFGYVTLIHIKDFVSEQWGDMTIYTFENETGSQFKWFTSSSAIIKGETTHYIELNETVNMIATIKKHDEFNGQKQNVINRPVFSK